MYSKYLYQCIPKTTNVSSLYYSCKTLYSNRLLNTQAEGFFISSSTVSTFIVATRSTLSHRCQALSSQRPIPIGYSDFMRNLTQGTCGIIPSLDFPIPYCCHLLGNILEWLHFSRLDLSDLTSGSVSHLHRMQALHQYFMTNRWQ